MERLIPLVMQLIGGAEAIGNVGMGVVTDTILTLIGGLVK